METSITVTDDNVHTNHVCYGCNLPIVDRFLSNVLDQLWHDKCIRCCKCQAVLKEKCFSRDLKLYCKSDFYRVFGVKCFGCEEGVFPSDLVRKVGAKIFHMSCLKCYQCQKEVSTGDQLYVIEDGSFLCKVDYENSTKKETKKGSPQKTDIETELDDNSPSTPSMNGDPLGSDEDEDANRRRGPRTTIKAKQLEVLKSAFLSTPKPSRHIREKLAQDTGLTMRVIQVWFQNRRSKERRVKQLSVHGRELRKNAIEKDGTVSGDMNYRFFQNATSNLNDYNQRAFAYDHYSNNNNNNISLPGNEGVIRETQDHLMKNKYNGDNDFNVIESFTSQLHPPGFNTFNNVHNFLTPVLPTYERL